MHIYNITKNIVYDNLQNIDLHSKDFKYFVICTSDEIISFQNIFNFDDETIQECLNIDENIRFEIFDNYDFISLNYFDVVNETIELEEVNLYIGHNYIILVGLNKTKIINEIENYINNRIQTIKNTEDILNKIYFWIFDYILKKLFYSLQELEDIIQELEHEIIINTHKDHFLQINKIREQLNKTLKHIRPLLYIGDQFLVNENKFISKNNLRFFKSIDTRINKLLDFTCYLKDIADKLIYLYDSSISTKTNDIATKLTIIAVFFAPLTVITGLYGMNFRYMPELNWVYGYPVILISMFLIIIVLYIIFKRKKWI
ncbi:magnesium transporter CorA family protein [Tepidibacter aestuarii]|uniref:magnesium transporter CorA family protein n=1 Tax=Tepidibacter aestuarii TaxID=2925782 RepID=UPI0020BF4B73|nr:magnesium transporter CorA family protein [Tepidibacter aestuarii]CAH2215063.1 magnesium transporter [Tepidibacter aestuarii]